MKYASTFEQYVFGGSKRIRDLPVGQRLVMSMSPQDENREVDWLDGNPCLVLTYKATWRRCIAAISTSFKPCVDDMLKLPITAQEIVDSQAHNWIKQLCKAHYGEQTTVHVLPDVHFYCTLSGLQLSPCSNIRRITSRDVDLVIDTLGSELRTYCEDAGRYILDNGPAFAWYEEDEPVGFASVHPSYMSDRIGNIGNVIVNRKYRRKGIARAVVSAIARALLDDGRMPVYGCWVDNVASMKTALSAGFKLGECNYRAYVTSDF